MIILALVNSGLSDFDWSYFTKLIELFLSTFKESFSLSTFESSLLGSKHVDLIVITLIGSLDLTFAIAF